MAIAFPVSLDDLPNPSGNDDLTNPDNSQLTHSIQHANANDAIEALEAKVGIDGSGVVTCLDYLLKNPASVDPGHVHSFSGLSFAAQAANKAFMGPTSGGSTTPAFRLLVAADIPSLPASILTSGTLGVTRGGTGIATLTANYVPFGNGTSAFQSSSTFTCDGTTLAISALNVGVVGAVCNISSWFGNTASQLILPSTGPSVIAFGANNVLAFAQGAGFFVGDANAGDNILMNAVGKAVLIATNTDHYIAKFVDYTATFACAQRVKRTTVADVNYTATVIDYLIAYTSLTTGRTVTLPAASTHGTAANPGIFIIQDETGTANTNNITIARAGADTINGATSKVINTAYGRVTLYSNGTNWFVA